MAKNFRDSEQNAAALAVASLSDLVDVRPSLYVKVEGHLFDKVCDGRYSSMRFPFTSN